MRSRTAEWFECKIRHEKTFEDGTERMVTETFAVDAMSFTEAESLINKQASLFVKGEMSIMGIRKATYKEVFFADNDSADKWYKAKLQFILIDEKSGKDKRTTVSILINAGTLNTAVKCIGEIMNSSMADYVVVSVTETQILDVFEYDRH